MSKANAQEIHKILSTRVDDVLRQIALDHVEVSLPLDGKGPRMLVRVEKGDAGKVPHFISVQLGRKILEVPLEASETYETYKAR